MGASAEFEQSLIVERTKAGLAAAKRRGKYPGRPKPLTPQQIKHARKMLDSGEETIGNIAALFGVDRTTFGAPCNKLFFIGPCLKFWSKADGAVLREECQFFHAGLFSSLAFSLYRLKASLTISNIELSRL